MSLNVVLRFSAKNSGDRAKPPSPRVSFDDFVRARQQRRRKLKIEGLGGLQVDDQFVLVRSLYREVRRLFALENAIDVAGCAPELVGDIRAIGDQAAAGDVVARGVNRGQSVTGRQRDDQIAMEQSPRGRRDDQAGIRGTGKG